MDCNELRPCFVDYLYGELPESEACAVETHLASCEACRRQAEETKALLGLYRDGPRPLPPPGAVAEALRTVREQPGSDSGRGPVSRPLSFWKRIAAHPAFATAAILVIAFIIVAENWESPQEYALRQAESAASADTAPSETVPGEARDAILREAAKVGEDLPSVTETPSPVSAPPPAASGSAAPASASPPVPEAALKSVQGRELDGRDRMNAAPAQKERRQEEAQEFAAAKADHYRPALEPVNTRSEQEETEGQKGIVPLERTVDEISHASGKEAAEAAVTAVPPPPQATPFAAKTGEKAAPEPEVGMTRKAESSSRAMNREKASGIGASKALPAPSPAPSAPAPEADEERQALTLGGAIAEAKTSADLEEARQRQQPLAIPATPSSASINEAAPVPAEVPAAGDKKLERQDEDLAADVAAAKEEDLAQTADARRKAVVTADKAEDEEAEKAAPLLCRIVETVERGGQRVDAERILLYVDGRYEWWRKDFEGDAEILLAGALPPDLYAAFVRAANTSDAYADVNGIPTLRIASGVDQLPGEAADLLALLHREHPVAAEIAPSLRPAPGPQTAPAPERQGP